MITLKKISLPEVRESVAIAYEGDIDLFEKYHVEPCDFFSACIMTMQMIRECNRAHELSHYKVIFEKKPIGYITIFDGFLYSFGIGIKYRKKQILIDVWEQIKKVLGKKFRSMLYVNNTRGINWLVKCGMRIQDQSDKTVLLINDK